MRQTADLCRTHYAAAAATIRHLYGLSLHVFGSRECRWREARGLVETAVNDPSTWLGAETGGLTYPARIVDIYQLAVQIGASASDRKAGDQLIDSLLPFTAQKAKPVTADEYEQETRNLLKLFGVPEDQYAAELEQLTARRRFDENLRAEVEATYDA